VLKSFSHVHLAWPCTAWHPDGKILAAVSGDRVIHLWDVASGKEVSQLEGTRSGGIRFTFNHRGDLLASNSWEGILRLWDTRTGKQVLSAIYPQHYDRLQFSPDDRLLFSGINDTKLRLLEVAVGREYRTLLRDPVLGQGLPDSTAVSGDGRLLAAGMHDGFGLWDLTSGKPLAFVRQRWTGCIRFEPDSSLLTYGMGGLWRWPVKPNPASPGLLQVGPPQALLSAGEAATFGSSRDGQVIAAGELGRGSVVVLHADRLDRPVRLVHGGDVWDAAVSPDGRFVATGCQRAPAVKVWEADTGKLVRVLLPQRPGCCVLFSPDGRWLATTSTSEGHLYLWSVGSWQDAIRIGGAGAARSTFSPDGKLLAVDDGQGAIRLIDPDTGRDYARLEDPNQDRGGVLSFSPDGTQLISSTHDSQSIHVWDLRAIRRQLAEMGLDWDLPPYPEAAGVPGPLEVKVVGAEALVPRDPMSLNNLAWQLVTGPADQRDLPRALKLIQDAVKMQPDKAMFLNTLGVVQYRMGQYTAAVVSLEKSLRLGKGEFAGFDLFFLAMCHARLGAPDKAKDCFDRAVKWWEGKKGLPGKYVAELTAFRAEAAKVLGEK
jgi:WD40 repeat protein